MPDEDTNPVKEILFKHISKQNREKIQDLISNKKSAQLINEAISSCKEKVLALGDNDEEDIGIFTTGLLHYLLTEYLIPSQRKITYNNLEVDIIIPDLRTLIKNPENALIVSFPKTPHKETIMAKIKELQTIQPKKENIWIVVNKKMEIKNKLFFVSGKDENFSNIINEIMDFVMVKKQNKFKIHKIG